MIWPEVVCACGRSHVGREVMRICPRSGLLIAEDHNDENCLRVAFDREAVAVVSMKDIKKADEE